MKQIPEATAAHLIEQEKAGWYAVDAKYVIPHPTQTVVFVRGKYFLVGQKEMNIQAKGTAQVNGVTKALHSVHVSDKLGRWLKAEAQWLKRPIPLESAADFFEAEQAGLPIIYTGSGRLPPRT